jgi:hypothetical protein
VKPVKLEIFDISDGELSYFVWTEWTTTEEKGDGWNVGCASTFKFNFRKTDVETSLTRRVSADQSKAEEAPVQYPKNFLYHRSNVVVSKAKYGEFATLLDDQYVGQYIREVGEWEDCVVSLLSLFFREGDVVWEGGSHIGTHTVPLARLVGGTGRVHTFEAHPKTRSIMQFNLLITGVFDSVTVHGLGLGDKGDDGKHILLGDGCLEMEGLEACDKRKTDENPTNSGGELPEWPQACRRGTRKTPTKTNAIK